MDIAKADILGPLIIVFAILCFVLNVLSLIILLGTTDLRKKRFLCLALYLSISDGVVGFESIVFFIIDKYTIITYESTTLAVCTILKTLIAGTVIFSLIQILLICLERLSATMKNSCIHLQRITSDKSVRMCFIVVHAYPFINPVVELLRGEESCVIKSTPLRLLVFDVPIIILTAAVVILYFLVIARIVIQHKKVHTTIVPIVPLTESQSEQQNESESSKRMKRNIVTLGLIIVIGLVSVVPRCVTSIIATTVGNTPNVITALEISNHFLVINPIVDPIIYILRIKEYRDRLRCRCWSTNQVTATNDYSL